MLNFKTELEKFKPILGIDGIEEQIATEDMRDIIDLIKESTVDKGALSISKNDLVGGEL